MSKRFDELIFKLQNVLQESTQQFTHENIKENIKVSELVNLILNAHLSSLFCCLEQISVYIEKLQENNEVSDNIIKLIHRLKSSIDSALNSENLYR